MISVYVYCKKEKDARFMTDLLGDTLDRLGGEQIVSQEYWIGGNRIDEDMGPTDIMVFEVSNNREFKRLITARKRNPYAKLLILNGHDKDPCIFVRPDLYPSGLLNKPVSTLEIIRLFSGVIRNIYREREKEEPGRHLIVPSGSDRYLVPFSTISYIEAQDKILLLHHEQGMICFRDTLRHLEEILPNYFYRVHRGIIVNFLHIRNIDMKSGSICMMDSTVIPMSLKFRRDQEKNLTLWDPGNRALG